MTSATQYTFRAEKAPSHREIHCLWATASDKAYENKADVLYKVVANGRLVHLICSKPLADQDVAIETNRFQFLRKQSVEESDFAAGAMVHLEGEMAYSVHSRTTNRDECPVDAFGRIKPHLKASFLRYLEKTTGLELACASEKELSFAWECRSDETEKVWLNDVITFSLVAKVKDPLALNRLAINAIGRRKSYGLGNARVASAVELAPAP